MSFKSMPVTVYFHFFLISAAPPVADYGKLLILEAMPYRIIREIWKARTDHCSFWHDTEYLHVGHRGLHAMTLYSSLRRLQVNYKLSTFVF